MGWRKLFLPQESRSRQELAPALPKANRRRSHRVSAFLPVFIYAYSHDEPFVEHAVTLNVSAGGGLLSLSRDVKPLQELFVANTQTDEELRCRVARVTKTEAGTVLVGFEFLRPAPRFWSIEFRS
ncbi:MAG: PilZ domain-containing protein [Candidatus Acidiferrales bacterium]